MAAEEKQEMGEGAGAAPGEKGPTTGDKAMGKTGATEEEKGDAAADKEKGSTAEKGATAGDEEEGEEEEEERATAGQKGENRPAAAKRGHKKKAEAEEMEGMSTWLSEIALSEKGMTAAERERSERRRFRRTKGQRPEEKGATKGVAGKKEIFFFKASAVITLESSDGMLFTMSEEAARLSVLLADMIDQDGVGGIIQLPNVDARALAMVVKYCKKHADAYANHSADEVSRSGYSEASEEALKEWDRKLVDGLSQNALCDLIIAANFLYIKGLAEAACQKVAVVDMVNCKTPGQMQHIEEDDMCTWFSGLTPFSEKGTAAAERARRERRQFKRTKGQRPEKKGATAEETEQVAGENDTFFFRASGKIITLKSSDGILFKVSEAAARLSVLLADMIDQGCAGGIIPLPNVHTRALATAIEYCNKHADAASANSRVDEGSSSSSNSEASEEALREWDSKLVDGLSQDALYDLMMAANFLHIKGLLDATCQKVADMVKGYSVEQMRNMFGIANDFTEEEEEELRKESPWAFEED